MDLRSVAQRLKPFGKWTSARLVFGLLVLGMHWSILNVLAQKLKSPSTVVHTSQPDLRVRWIDPVPKTGEISNTNIVSSSALGIQKQNSQGDASTVESTHANDSESQSLKDTFLDSKINQGWNPLYYRTTQEVDTRAVPTIDWTINRESIPKKGFTMLIVTIWVSASGVIDHFQIEDQEPKGDWASAALLFFQTTLMEPATLGGKPVASTMTVEISLDNTNNEPGTN